MRSIQTRAALAMSFFLAACGPSAEAEDPSGVATTTAKPPPAKPASTAEARKARPAPRADESLIPREILFGNPDRMDPRISPDGKRLAFLAPEGGVLNVWVGPANDIAAAKPVTQEKTRNLYVYSWGQTNEHILYRQDKGGDENWHIFSVDLKTNQVKDLTPIDGIQARIVSTSHKHPDEVLIALNDRDKKSHDIHRVNIRTGDRKLVQKNETGFVNFTTDADFKVRLASRTLPDGGTEIVEPDGKDGWRSFAKIGQEDAMTTMPALFNTAGDKLYLFDSRGRDTAALVTFDTKTRKSTVTAEDPKADMMGVITHPKERHVQAVSSIYDRRRWQVLDKKIQPDLDYLRGVDKGDVEVLSRSLDDKRWIVGYLLDDGPYKYYLYDREKKPKATFLFSNQKALEGLPFTKMHARVIKSRDGLDLVSYLSLPKASDPDADGKPDKPLAMALLVHGGPWGRDVWGFDPMHQWLANRGYAVLSVQFRGSTGLGKKFTNAGDKQWGAKMHDDLLDAVDWAAAQGIADRSKVAIMGGSYGGYATLVGLTFTPETFACGVDVVGPSNLVTLLETIPPYWAPMIDMFTTRIGDHRTEEGKKFLLSRSPLHFVDRIKRPLLIGQGANDPRVKQSESDQIVKAMQEKKIPVTYVLYSDEGHGFARPENDKAFNAVAEVFLAQCLGGPYEPIGDDFKGSSIQVPEGAGEIHGLSEALSRK
ncbi:MAG TPA: S9 family peptidase [Polyangiaceae bacterium]|nr:S9 family peptidase [Polyangiaceae bacterium]